MENYIVINGKKAELTEEQLKALGIEPKQDNKSDKFEKQCDKKYSYISEEAVVYSTKDCNAQLDARMYDVANYCTDKELMEQRALHEILNRLLWRFSCKNGELDNKWDGNNVHYYVYYTSSVIDDFVIGWHTIMHNQGTIYFSSVQNARRAIDEIIKPFMEEHTDFVW